MTNTIILSDTHAHLMMHDDIDGIIWRCDEGTFPEPVTASTFVEKKLRVGFVLVPGVDVQSSKQAIELSQRFPQIKAAVGIHPNHCNDSQPDDWRTIEKLVGGCGVVAVGETGLDCYWDTVPLSTQHENFQRHIKLSRQLRLPVIIHCREAYAELMPVLRKECVGSDPLFGVIHSFSGGIEQMKECVELGFYISFAGAVTFGNKKFTTLWEAAAKVPDERLLIETDTPFIVPTPYRNKLESNEPIMTAYIANRLAELRHTTLETIAEQTTKNAQRLFEIVT
ncbi:MAG: TatD family hydrolase [Planctomycetaceae bacterium]|jgi:TatD DNase family protein|nr:TatD family hydrolase [Planctomycetaceae bacterium]